MKRVIRASEAVFDFDVWYDSLPSNHERYAVDDLADEMGLPEYDECSKAELAQLHDAYESNNGDDDWSPYAGGTYRISSDRTGGSTDDPKKAIEMWFQFGEDDPMNTAISCEKKEDAIKLCKAATPELITALGKKYKCPYKIDWLIDEAAKKVADGQKYFLEGYYGDTIHPFSVG